MLGQRSSHTKHPEKRVANSAGDADLGKNREGDNEFVFVMALDVSVASGLHAIEVIARKRHHPQA
jgi:hypothetical protein